MTRTTRIIGKGKVKLRLIYGRIRTLHGVLHIPGLDQKFDLCKKNGGCKKTVFEKET
jgi:hypothetical protein